MDRGSSANPEQHVNQHEPLTDSLKQEIYKLEIWNRHIKKENETLKEQRKLDKAIHDNKILHLGLWYKKNRTLKRKNRNLNKTVISLKYRILMKKTRMVVTSKRRKRRKLDVLAEVSGQMQQERRVHNFGKLSWGHAMILQWGYVGPHNYSLFDNFSHFFLLFSIKDRSS